MTFPISTKFKMARPDITWAKVRYYEEHPNREECHAKKLPQEAYEIA